MEIGNTVKSTREKRGTNGLEKNQTGNLWGSCGQVAVCFTASRNEHKNRVYAADMGAVYGIFEHGVGWSAYHGDQTAERAGNGTYVTAIRASLSGQPEGMSGTLSYQVNLSGSGWLSWQENMAETGTIETGMPLEAIRMELTGQLKDHYDVYYSVFQNGSWTAPVKNGETAGTEDRDFAWTESGLL